MPDFTEGKWEILKLEKSPYYYVGKKDSPNFLATVNTEANARLIAAAPDMYNILVYVNSLLEDPRITEILNRINGKKR